MQQLFADNGFSSGEILHTMGGRHSWI